MFQLFKKLSAFALITFIFIGFMPLAFAQSSDPLDAVKDRLEEEGIQVIDYSENKWGRLPERIYEALDNEDYESLPSMYEYLEELVEGSHNNNQKLEEAINMLSDELLDVEYEENNEFYPLTNEDIQLITDEILAYRFAGERQLRDVVQAVVNVMRNLIAGLAIIWIIISGIRMVMAGGDENTITEQKRSIIYAAIGLVAILLIERMIDILYGPAGAYEIALRTETATRFSAEIYGVINFIKAIIGAIAILMIVISGIKTIFAAGEEEQISKQRKTIIWIVIGIILLIIDQVIVEQIFIVPVQYGDQIQASNVTSIINLIGRITQFILGFVGLLAFGMLIYGAGTMIANYGNEETVQKAKKIIKNAIIGIIVIISAYTIVSTLIMFG